MKVVCPKSIQKADAFRRAGNWRSARDIYVAALATVDADTSWAGSVAHNAALCSFAMGLDDDAVGFARQAIGITPDLWQSRMVLAKALRRNGKVTEAMSVISKAMKTAGSLASAMAELSDIAINELGDIMMAADAANLMSVTPSAAVDAQLTRLVASMYDRRVATGDLLDMARDFASNHLQMPRVSVSPKGRRGGALRIGLLSPFFHVSPVYFFCHGALSALGPEFSLVFFNRGARCDSATTRFRSIAADWHECQGLDAERLAARIAAAEIDVLVDMGGWSDVNGLKACSAHPAPVQFKWVGGQSATTGLNCFDGFITDSAQSPDGSESFHTEPLIRFERGYVTYSVPAYLPSPIAADSNAAILGVIANPAKISAAFLAFVGETLKQGVFAGQPVCLRFIDRRMVNPLVRERILSALANIPCPVEFVSPDGHEGYLREVACLTAVLDTFPYAGGLTVAEALALGVPVLTHGGQHFSERHSVAHCHFANGGNLSIEALLAGDKSLLSGPRASFLAGSPRVDHGALAGDLANLFRSSVKQ